MTDAMARGRSGSPLDRPTTTFCVRRTGSTVTVTGEIDAFAAPVLSDVLAAGSVDMIDLSGVTFFSAAGVNVLIGVCHDHGCDPLVRTSRAVDHLLALCSPDSARRPNHLLG